MSAPTPTAFGPATGPAVEREIAADIVKRALPVAPVLLLVAFLGWGADGVTSSAFGLALVLANFVAAAALLSWAAGISLALLTGMALFGYVARLAVVTGVVLLVKDESWVALWPLGLTIVIAHLGLLLWETRYVSASLAFPGLKPRSPSLEPRREH